MLLAVRGVDMSVVAVVLAAGASSRMGAPKAMLKLNNFLLTHLLLKILMRRPWH